MATGGHAGKGSAQDALPQANSAQREVKETSSGLQAALEALHGPLVPLSSAEGAAFRSSIARARAAAEARRAPSPQLSLPEAA
jgi:hypothetical protein